MKITNRTKEIQEKFARKIASKGSHKLRAKKSKEQTVWFGLGLLGLIGWSVVIPTLLGLAIGIWLDQKFPSPYSWTLMLMIGGLLLGCFNASHWVQGEQAQIKKMQNSQPKESNDD
jgi:ATP synthase protein I